MMRPVDDHGRLAEIIKYLELRCKQEEEIKRLLGVIPDDFEHAASRLKFSARLALLHEYNGDLEELIKGCIITDTKKVRLTRID